MSYNKKKHPRDFLTFLGHSIFACFYTTAIHKKSSQLIKARVQMFIVFLLNKEFFNTWSKIIKSSVT